MREPPLLIQTPSDRYFNDDHCANCLEPLPEDLAGLFCSTWCAETTGLVRYMRRVTRDGRIDEPDVQYAIQIQTAHLLNGGYQALGRHLTVETRRQVKERDGGRCVKCGNPGTEIDHIDGSRPDLSNLQLLCADCHHAKTAEHLAPAAPDHVFLIQALKLTRVEPDLPRLLADDQGQWVRVWPTLKKERKQRLIAKIEASSIYLGTFTTTAELIEALRAAP